MAPAPVPRNTDGFQKSITIEDPTSSENITLFYADVPLTVYKVNTVVSGTSPSVTFNVKFASTRTASGTALFSSDQAVTSTTGGDELVTFANASISKNTWVWVTTSATSGTVNEASITVLMRIAQ